MNYEKRNIYEGIKCPERVLNIAIFCGIFILAMVIVFSALNGGHTVSFDLGDGYFLNSAEFKYGEKISEPTLPTRKGYVFNGWYGDKELSREFDFDSNVYCTEDITIYASWIPDTAIMSGADG